jgi:predicted metalloprotease
MPARLVALLLAIVCAVGAAACGGEDLQERARDVRDRAEQLGERIAERVREQLAEIRREIPAASLERPRTAGRTEAGRIDGFLTEVLTSVDEYWTRTLRASGVEEPRVTYLWVPPGARLRTGCGAVADDGAAFYCSADDTIYVAQVFAEQVWDGTRDDFPGTRAGYGRAVGDFGLAYVVAHEYAHNLSMSWASSRSARAAGRRPSSCRPTASPASGATPSTAPACWSRVTWRRR